MLKQFYVNLEKQTKHLGLLIQNSFSELFDEKKLAFETELNDKNFKIFEDLTAKFIDHCFQEQQKGRKIDGVTQDRLLEQSQTLFDQMAFDSFKTQSEAYLKNIQDEIDAEMNGLMLMNLQSLSAGGPGQVQSQFKQNLQNLVYLERQRKAMAAP